MSKSSLRYSHSSHYYCYYYYYHPNCSSSFELFDWLQTNHYQEVWKPFVFYFSPCHRNHCHIHLNPCITQPMDPSILVSRTLSRLPPCQVPSFANESNAALLNPNTRSHLIHNLRRLFTFSNEKKIFNSKLNIRLAWMAWFLREEWVVSNLLILFSLLASSHTGISLKLKIYCVPFLCIGSVVHSNRSRKRNSDLIYLESLNCTRLHRLFVMQTNALKNYK